MHLSYRTHVIYNDTHKLEKEGRKENIEEPYSEEKGARGEGETVYRCSSVVNQSCRGCSRWRCWLCHDTSSARSISIDIVTNTSMNAARCGANEPPKRRDQLDGGSDWCRSASESTRIGLVSRRCLLLCKEEGERSIASAPLSLSYHRHRRFDHRTIAHIITICFVHFILT